MALTDFAIVEGGGGRGDEGFKVANAVVLYDVTCEGCICQGIGLIGEVPIPMRHGARAKLL